MLEGLKAKVVTGVGMIFGAGGAAGAVGVCSTGLCTATASLLTAVGIATSATPLVFLNDYWPIFIIAGISMIYLGIFVWKQDGIS